MEFDTNDGECAFHKSSTGVCSDAATLQKLKPMVAQTNDPRDVINILKKKYDCGSESCVIKKAGKDGTLDSDEAHQILRNNFKPVGPRDTFEWLSNSNIDQVLDQIEKKYTEKKFHHINFQMIDFEEMGTELAKLDFPALYKQGKRTFGTVINTDVSSGQGIHWFAIFGDFSDNSPYYTIEYFNSSGEAPMDEIYEWMAKVKHKWASSFDKPIKTVDVSKIQHQKDDHSCGPYSLYYIISRLDGVPYSRFKSERISDVVMHDFRKYLFRGE